MNFELEVVSSAFTSFVDQTADLGMPIGTLPSDRALRAERSSASDASVPAVPIVAPAKAGAQ